MTMQLSHGFAPNMAKCPLLAQIHEWIAVPRTQCSHARMSFVEVRACISLHTGGIMVYQKLHGAL